MLQREGEFGESHLVSWVDGMWRTSPVPGRITALLAVDQTYFVVTQAPLSDRLLGPNQDYWLGSSAFNEAEMLDDEGQRVVVVDVVGRHGSPDRGVSIEVDTVSSYDFAILAGSYYLGGLRHEIGGLSAGSSP